MSSSGVQFSTDTDNKLYISGNNHVKLHGKSYLDLRAGNTIDLSSLPVGTYNYTYSITNANTCSNSTTVTITILEAPESGTASASY